MSMPTTVTMPTVVAHRGASGLAPENTLAAISLAAQQGASWIEIDINLSRDGVPVLHHDDDVSRCSNGEGLIIEQTLAELKTLDCGSWFASNFAAEPVATLDECLDLCLQLGLGINLEIKPTSGHEVATTQGVADTLLQRDVLPPLVISSFSHLALQTASVACPQIARATLYVVLPPDWQALAREINAVNVHLHANSLLDQSTVAAIHAESLRLYCYTVNTIERADPLLQIGVNGVISNFPERLLQGLPTTA